MNNVAVTDGDKVEAERVLGYHVDYYPINDVMTYYDKVKDADVKALVASTSRSTNTSPNWKTASLLHTRRYGTRQRQR
jgi:L-arabinose isomerase